MAPLTGWNLINGRWTMNKDPAAVRNYGIDWTAWLADLPLPGDSVATAVWVLSDLALVNNGSNVQGNITLIKLGGGTLNSQPTARCTITTTLGQEVQPLTLNFNMVTQ